MYMYNKIKEIQISPLCDELFYYSLTPFPFFLHHKKQEALVLPHGQDFLIFSIFFYFKRIFSNIFLNFENPRRFLGSALKVESERVPLRLPGQRRG